MFKTDSPFDDRSASASVSSDPQSRYRAATANAAGSGSTRHPQEFRRSFSGGSIFSFQRSSRSSWTPTLDHDPAFVLTGSDAIFNVKGMKPVVEATADFSKLLFRQAWSQTSPMEDASVDPIVSLLHAHLRSQQAYLQKALPPSAKPPVSNRIVERIESYLVEYILGPTPHSGRDLVGSMPRQRLKDESIQFRAAAINIGGGAGVKWPHLLDVWKAADEIRKLAGGLHLLTLDALTTPAAKVSAILNVQRGIVDVLSHHSTPQPVEEQEFARSTASSADELLPLLIWVIVHINPPRLHSNLTFIRRFRHREYLENAAEDYALTNFEAALEFIRSYDLTTLGIEDSIAERYPP
ncbi:Rab5 GDP/GTP exchange factor [Gonapodya sp. JEL0774]|nr:Rab5 GDP/GTP exchange factor [Gonapodya sp. JEL0774]